MIVVPALKIGKIAEDGMPPTMRQCMGGTNFLWFVDRERNSVN
jgi:hypothetical protein